MKIIYGANYGRPTLDLNFARNKSLIDTISGQNFVTFSRSQTGREATYVGSDGLIKYASADEPRFDHDPLTGECLGLLVEEQRTNLVTKSEDNTGWNNAGGTTTISNAGSLVLSPSNTTNVTLSTPVSGFVNRNTVVVYTISQPTSNTIYTFSCFIKKKDLKYVVISLTQEAWAYWQTAFDLDTGTLLTSSAFAGPPTNTNYTIQSYPNGWYRFSVTMGLTNTGGATSCNIGFTNKSTGVFGSGGQASYVADGISGGYLWGAQVEEGSFPTSYIPTDGTPGGKTRSADQASITGTNFSRWYNQSEGTLFSASRRLASNSNTYAVIGGSNPNVTSSIRLQLISNGNTQAASSGGGVIVEGSSGTDLKKYVGAYALNNFNASINGSVNATQTSNTIVTCDRFYFGGIFPTNAVNGIYSRLTYYPTRLQNYQLQQITK